MNEQEGRIVAVSTDSQARLRRSRYRAEGVVYVADPERRIIDRYGVADESFGKECARPAAFLLDRDGVVRARHLTDDWRVRLDDDEALTFFETGRVP